jgi:hypothetical protein
MLDAYGVQNGELAMYIAYGGKDEFNIDAQVESFLWVARERGIQVSVAYDPRGRHDVSTGRKFFPGFRDWLAQRLAPYSSPRCGAAGEQPCLSTVPSPLPVPPSHP